MTHSVFIYLCVAASEKYHMLNFAQFLVPTRPQLAKLTPSCELEDQVAVCPPRLGSQNLQLHHKMPIFGVAGPYVLAKV